MRRAVLEKFAFIPVLAIILAVYVYSLCPTLYVIDSGELAAVSYTLGIAHPTGYPLYTLISYFFSRVPGDPVRNLNLLSALFSLGAALLIYLTARAITGHRFIPALAASLFAFSPTIWRTTVTNEVYPLTALFCAALIFFSLRIRTTRDFCLMMYLCGLSFTNHMSVFALAVPACAYVIIRYRPSWKTMCLGAILAVLGVTPYIYLIARASAGPAVAWGDLHDLQRLMWHMTGRQYQVWMFSQSFSEIIANARQGISFLANDLAYIFLIPCLVGMHYLFRRERSKFFLFISMIAVNFLYTINYAIPDIESYYIPGLTAFFVLSIYGLKVLSRYLKWFIAVPLALLIPLLHYQSSTLRANYFGREFSLAHFSQLPDNALLISNYWDIISPAIYLQAVERQRPDIVIIDKELMRRTWYVNALRRQHPQLFASVAGPVSDYMKELVKFEYNRPYDPNAIQFEYIKMLEALVAAKQRRGVFFALPFPDHDLQQVKPEPIWIPYGLVFAVTGDTTVTAFDFSRLALTRPRIVNDVRLAFNIRVVEQMAQSNIRYLTSRNQMDAVQRTDRWLKNFKRQRQTD
jgi:hypothetical protein